MKIKDCYIEQIVGITVNGNKYFGKVVEIKVDNVNDKHSAVFKSVD